MVTAVITDNTSGSTLGGTADTWLNNASQSTNYGSSSTFQVQNNATNDKGCIVLYFPLPAGLAGGTVSAVRLKLKISSTSTDWGSKGQHVDLREMLRAFTEGGATWLTYDGSNSWATGGGVGTGDQGVTLLDSFQPDTAGGTVYTLSAAALVSMIQDKATAAASEVRFILRPRNLAETAGSFAVFHSSEASDGDRPILEIDYTPAGGGTTVGAGLVQPILLQSRLRGGLVR